MYLRDLSKRIIILALRSHNILFLLFLPIVIIFTLPYHQGFTIGDCGDYLCAANQLIHGNWDIIHNFYATRIGTYFPYAVGMKLFGFGTWLTWITTVELLLLLATVYFVLRKYNPSIALIACMLLGTAPIILQYSSVVMGDIASTLCSNAVILLLFYFRFYVQKNEWNVKKWGIAIAIVFFAAFLVKESIAFFVPFLFLNYWQTRNEKSHITFWKYALITLTALTTCLFFAYWTKTGNPFYKIMAVENGPTASDCNYVGANWLAILNRITWQPFQFLSENYTFSYFFLLGTLQFILPHKNASKQEKFFQFYFLSSIAIWWIGSQGITAYNPVSLVHRVWLPILVPMAINASFFIYKMVNHEQTLPKHRIIFVAIIIGVLTWLVLSLSINTYSQLSLSNTFFSTGIYHTTLVTFIVLSLLWNLNLDIFPDFRSLFFLFVLHIPIRGCVEGLFWGGDKKYFSEKKMIEYTLSKKGNQILVDYWVSKGYFIYTGFEKRFPFKNYSDSCVFDNNTYLLLNKTTQTELIKNINETRTFTKGNNNIPEFVIHPEQYHFVLIKENETNYLYQYVKQSNV